MRVLCVAAASIALGICAHLLGTPLGHDGSWRDLAILAADLAALYAFRRGQIASDRYLVFFAAGLIACGLLASEGLDRASLSEFISSIVALILLSIGIAVSAIVFAFEAVRAVVELALVTISANARVDARSPLVRARDRLLPPKWRRYRPSSLRRRGPPFPALGFEHLRREFHTWASPTLGCGIKKQLHSS
jgi:hypothetical protein